MARKFVNDESEAQIEVGQGDQSGMFLPGFHYMLGGTEYTVIKQFVADNTEMRRVVRSDGGLEEMTVETILKDCRQHDFTQLEEVKLHKKS